MAEVLSRSSCIFPVFSEPNATASISFLAYWNLKSSITIDSIKFTLRTVDGEKVAEKIFQGVQSMSMALDVADCFKNELGMSSKGSSDVTHSIEVEIFSESSNLFSYPALLLEVTSPRSYGVVHSCFRTFNDCEPIPKADDLLCLPQSGFDIVYDGQGSNAIYTCSGNFRRDYNVTIDILDPEGGLLSSCVRQYESVLPKSLLVIDIDPILDGLGVKHGTYLAKLHVEDVDFFPRWIVSKSYPNGGRSLTHSFFDTSRLIPSSDSTRSKSAVTSGPDSPYSLSDGVMAVPVDLSGHISTELVSYACNASFEGQIVFELIALSGELLARKVFETKAGGTLQAIQNLNLLQDVFSEQKSDASHSDFAQCKISFLAPSLPCRLKFGLNLKKYVEGKYLVGSNICFAPVVSYAGMLQKPLSRNWSPIGGPKDIQVFYASLDPRISFAGAETQLHLQVFSERGLVFEKSLEFCSTASLLLNADSDLFSGLDLRSGSYWLFLTSDFCHASGFFFSKESDFIGGDHMF